jgi:predicted Rdx family selenoprotein
MPDVAIQYCARCEHVDEATAVRRLVCDRLGDDVGCETVRLAPREEPTFRITVDGEEVWSVDPDTEHIDPLSALNAVRYEVRAT